MKVKSIIAVIINYKQYSQLKKCVSCIVRESLPAGYSLDIVVVDGQADNIEEKKIKKLFPKITFIPRKENLGVGKACNIGFSYAIKKKATYILLLAPDIYFKKNAISHLVKSFSFDKGLDLVGAKLLSLTKPRKILFVNGAIDPIALSAHHTGFNEVDRNQFDRIQHTDFVNFPCLFKTNILSQVERMDEGYFMYYEDIDWYTRLIKSGFKIGVEPSAIAYTNDANPSRLSESRKNYYNARNLLYYISKNFSFKRKIIAYTYMLKRITCSAFKILNSKENYLFFYELLGIYDFLLRKKGYKNIQ